MPLLSGIFTGFCPHLGTFAKQRESGKFGWESSSDSDCVLGVLFINPTRGYSSLAIIMAPCNQTSTDRSSRSRPRRVKQISSLDGMFAANTTTSPPIQLLHAVHESSESENMNTIQLLRRVKRRLLLEMAADAQSVQALEEGAPQTPETPVKLARQEFQKMSLVCRMKPIRPLSVRPVQKVSNGAVALCDLEPATFQLSRAQAAWGLIDGDSFSALLLTYRCSIRVCIPVPAPDCEEIIAGFSLTRWETFDVYSTVLNIYVLLKYHQFIWAETTKQHTKELELRTRSLHYSAIK
jgi:hypothetical protein